MEDSSSLGLCRLKDVCACEVTKEVQENHQVLVCPKHFAVNEQETYRRGSSRKHYDVVVDGADAVAAGNDIAMLGGPPVIAQILRGYREGRVVYYNDPFLLAIFEKMLILANRISISNGQCFKSVISPEYYKYVRQHL